MSSRIHPQARTTPKIRQEIKDSSLSDRQAAKVFNISRVTARKWLKRDDVQDRSHRAHTLYTTLSAAQEAILTDNGSQFTDRFATKDKKPSGQHAFDVACAALAAERRLAPPRHPQTNGMVERFNGRINELLQQTRFDSRADLQATLMNYLKLYNHHIAQRALDAKTPILALKEWQQKRPELFIKRVYDQTGLDR